MVDVKAEYLGLSAQGWREMINNWWDLALGYMLIASIALGLGSIVFMLFRKAKQRWLVRNELTELPKTVERYLEGLKASTLPLCPERKYPQESKSFGAFCGKLNYPPTPAQVKLLTQWDIIVLDPLQQGVLEVLGTKSICTSKHILGRLDVGLLVAADKSSRNGSAKVVRSLGVVTRALVQALKRPQDMHSPFTGVLLANWEEHFQPVVVNELVRYIGALGLDIYLEVSPPNYLGEQESRAINMEPIRGIVCRNGSIFPNGERRNYFQMETMRHSLRALAAKSAMVSSIVIMWDTVDDNVKLEHAVVKRSFTWCNFSSALSWIGPQSALTNAEVAVRQTVNGEPLGAMMWLKEDAIMKSQEIWRGNDRISKSQCGDHAIYETLNDFIPNLAEKVSLNPFSDSKALTKASARDDDEYQWPWKIHPAPTNLPQFSSHGLDVADLGCFQLGLHCSSEEYTDLVLQQSRLRDLDMLECLKPEELRKFGNKLHDLYEAQSFWASTPEEALAVKELLTLLTTAKGDEDDGIRVYVGLDSGFRTTGTTRFCQFWGLYDYDISTGVMNIYISGKTKDRVGTILHTFMSSRECTRAQCFMAEIALAEQEDALVGDWELPGRLQRDIELLTPAENILFMQRLTASEVQDFEVLAARIRACCEYQLLEVPSLQQLKALNAETYLEGKITAAELVTSRLNWYTEKEVLAPDARAAHALFNEIEVRVSEALMRREANVIDRLEVALTTLLKKKQIDASADFFALSVFCAFRKLALNEVLFEINDRNPLPHPQSDQAACFAEMFALGSGCESYFGMTPTVVGKILTDMSQKYYQANQPPMRDDFVTELPTAYSSKLIDLDPNAGQKEIPFYYHATFLGIFAIPAFIDILMLTTMGRGLYLTTYMSEIEKSMATTALMVSLFLCGAIGTWVSSGGSYYLHSMTFSAMNMFVLTRFIAGFSICLTGGLLALIMIGVTKGFYAGFIFMIYFLILNTYLTLLATLSIYQFPGFNFQSGRIIIMMRIPILLVSPIVTLFIHKHDVIIYLATLIVFVISLLFGLRTMMAQWSTWYLNIPCVTDVDVAKWYNNKYFALKSTSEKMDNDLDISTTPIPRQTLLRDVLKETNRKFWEKPTTDKQVLELAQGYEATIFMMDWYCKYSRAKMPYAYSPTWNLQCKAAVCTLRDMQKGVKLHNAFVHWRNAGDELWGGVLYFVIALLDKWVALISGGSIVGLSDASSETFRLPVGFGLAYYLIGAVSLDGVSQPLWMLAQKNLDEPITSIDHLKKAATNNAAAKRVLYWKYITKFFFVHIWGLAFTSALMWSFDNSKDGTIMYMAYVGAYSGLLWYQYNRIYTGPLAFKEPLIAVIFGLTTGLLLHAIIPTFAFNSVISLATATWTAAILSAWTAHLGGPRPKHYDTGFKRTNVVHTSTALAHDHQPSQNALMEMVDSICTLPEDLRYRLDPFTHPGVEVMKILETREDEEQTRLVQTAFPDADELIKKTAQYWKCGDTVIDLVPMRHLIGQERKTRSIVRTNGKRVHIFVFLGLDQVGSEWVMDIRRNCAVVAEAIIQATCESRLSFSHDHSILAEVLAVSADDENGLSVPEGVKRQLQNSAVERETVIRNGDRALLRYLLLGLDCDIDWDLLPKNIRAFLLKRACGESCQVSDSQLQWISSRFGHDKSLDIEEYIARCNLGATLTVLTNSFAGALEADYTHRDQPEPLDSSYERCIEDALSPATLDAKTRFIDIMKMAFLRIHHAFRSIVKFVSVALVADPEFQRELAFLLSGKPMIVRGPIVFLLSGVWNYTKTLQRLIIPRFIFHGREGIAKIHQNMKGMTTTIKKNRIVVESLSGPSTCFFTDNPDGTSELRQYAGQQEKNPGGLAKLMAINTYGPGLVLRQREEYAKESLVNRFNYEYHSDTGGRGRNNNAQLPMERQCTAGVLNGQLVFYDSRGYITSGSFIKDENLVQFKFEYRKNARFDDELLRAEYLLPHVTIQVVWSAPPANHSPKKLNRWIPHTKVTEATFSQGGQIYKCKWHYEHKFHPVINTTLNGQEVDTPPMVADDWFGVLQKPKNTSFVNENPLYTFNSVKTNIISRFLNFNRRWHPISTSRARTHLWKSWKEGKELDACTARWLDEWSLRRDKDLKTYWHARDIGRLAVGENYMNSRADTIMARVDIDPEISSWTPLAFKISDLLSFGQGGDARINTRTQEAQMQDTDNELHILAMDTGTWPNEGGGVSACRRDMVNNLDTIRWHIVAENANDFGVPKFQIEKNVQSLTVLPLWGMDFLTPTHGIFQNCLDSSIEKKIHNFRDDDIKKRFLPILKTLVLGSRAITIDRQMIEETTKALCDLNTYFESQRHWGEVWKSDIVKQAWRELWLAEDLPNCKPISQWLDAEKPTLLHMDNALDMWHRYLFIFSIPVPEKIPDVFQASHHFAGASYGIVCKVKRNCTFHVWDHCISWREVTVFLSSSMSFDSPFVCNSLISLSKLASTLILHHADVVLPCADFFNPGWEVEIGSQENTIEHRKSFARKIDPVVNGICNMESFQPIEKIKSKVPTVVMLSHVRFVKDIKTAILAADMIVNIWGFTDYQLHIYGDMEKAPAYSVECQEIIAAKSLRDNVVLKGLGSPSKVLEDAWLFLNSSVSEGLPLAMGEAALTGVPVVCTDVGASFRVVTDPVTWDRFSAVVAPNDAVSLARAQVNVMGLLDEWSKYAEDAPGFTGVTKMSLEPSKEEVAAIQQRMYEKQEQRRKLGMMGRDNVLNSFSEGRYLREHEQMLWIGKYQAPSYKARMDNRPLSSLGSYMPGGGKGSYFNSSASSFNPRYRGGGSTLGGGSSFRSSLREPVMGAGGFGHTRSYASSLTIMERPLISPHSGAR